MDWAVFWTAAGSIAQATATLLALAALWYTIKTFNKSLKMLHYGELDRMYSDLLKIAIDKPHLQNPNVIQTDEQKREYEYYAQMVWCFVETIYDRATPDNQLLEIWYTAAEVENRLHREWFDRPENAYMFRPEFRKYIAETFPEGSCKGPK